MSGFAPRTVTEAMASAADLTDVGFTFVDEHRREVFRSFHDLVADAYRTAGALRATGLQPGDRVVLVLAGQQSFVVAFLGALAAGLVPVPVYPPLSPARAESWGRTTLGILTVARPAAVVTSADIRALLWSAAARVDATVLTADELAAAPDRAWRPAPADPDDVAFLQFTSGSTGAPRGVVVRHRNVVANCARIVGDFLRPTATDVGVSWLPLYHDMGLIGFVLAPFFARRPVVHLDTLAFLKRPALWLELVDRHRATVTFAPAFAYALAVRRIRPEVLREWDLSCLRVAGCGAEPIAAVTLRAFTEHLAPAGLAPEALCPCYGLAETTLVATYTPAGQAWRSRRVDAEHLLSHDEARPPGFGARTFEVVGCGTAIPGHEVRVVGADGAVLPDLRVGEIELSGPSVADGYHADPAATARSWRDGRLRTGDLGFLDDGHLFVTGRHSDVVIVHGRNYAPQTIEWALTGVPGIRPGNVVAFGCPDADGAERVVVVCESRDGDPAAMADAVRRRVSAELALTVHDVLVLPPGALPKTSSGKVQRARTRALFRSGELERRPRRWVLTRLRLRAGVGAVRYRMSRRRRAVR